MTRIKIILSIFCILLLTIHCASPLKGRVLENQNPEYKEYISPITIPLTPEYKSARYEFESSVVAVGGNSSLEFSMKGSYEISVMGDLLLWDGKITSAKKDGQVFSPQAPIADYRFLTNKQGKIQEMEMSFPGLEQLVKQRGRQGPAWDQIRENMKDQMKGFTNVLNHNPVKSGDWILKSYWNKQELEFVIQGYSFHEGQKVIAAKFNDSVLVEGRKMDIRGYCLLDAQTYHWIKQEMYFSVPYEGETVSGYLVNVAKRI
jgi:co-chaperonin GroES (HSP10)